MSAAFTYTFLLMTGLCLGFFAAAEIWPDRRNRLAAVAAVWEAVVFVMLAWVFYRVEWSGVPVWFMALLPLAGAGFALRMAWRRLAEMPV